MLDAVRKVMEAGKSALGIVGDQRDIIPEIPEEIKQRSSFLNGLFTDSRNYRQTFFFNRLNVNDPVLFWNYCHLLETGDHWRVWGTRIKNKEEDWKAELVEDEIGNQIRIKTAYLTANWHRFSFHPNIQNIDKIVFQEQQKTRWGSNIIEIVKRMSKYGTCVVKSYVDFDIDPRGVATEMPLDNSGVFVSPFSINLSKNGGCWYVIHASVKPKWYVLNRYKKSMQDLDVNPSDIKTVLYSRYSDIRGASIVTTTAQTSFQHTSLCDVLEFWIDDFTEEETPFDPQEVQMGISHLLQGEAVPVPSEQNHKKMVEGYVQYLQERQPLVDTNSQDEIQQFDALRQVIAGQVAKHVRYRTDGMRLKYPNGRKIVQAGGQIVEDVSNPFEFDWRELFHWINFEAVDGQMWGRGMAEIMWNTQKSLDLMKSRIADMGLWAVPEVWLQEDNKRIMQKDGYTKNPQKPKYYSGNPPVIPQSRAPMEFLEMFKLDKADAQNKQGINNLTYGADPGADFSGKAINMLLSQNSVIVTGEANTHLSDALERIVSTRLKIMKQIYTEPRSYFINGTFEPVIVSKLLSEQPVTEGGEIHIDPQTQQPVMQAIPDMVVTVVPSSNLPNQWERDLATMISLLNLPPQPDGTPAVPIEALWDQLAEKYSEFAPGGVYRKSSKALAIGMKILQEQAQKEQLAQENQADGQKLQQGVARSIVRNRLKEKMEQYAPPPNGNE